MRKFLYLLMALVMSVALAACNDNSSKKEADSSKADSKTEAAADTKADAPMKVGFLYISPVGDAGYSYAHDLGRQMVANMPGVETSFVESVPEGPDSERVILNMARNGYKLIFATSFGYMDPVIKVAKDFPDTVFMHCSGYKTAPNAGTYFGRMYQARYLTGIVAGAMTKSNKLGYVAAFPIPEVIRGINAFTLGAQSVNPDVEVRVVWTKTWYDPATEKEAAKSLLDVGCDVIAQHQDSPGPQEAAQEKGVYSIGYNSDMSKFAPKSQLTAAIWNWGVMYKDIIEQVKAGTWKSEQLWWGIDKGVVDIAPYGPMVPESVKTTTEEAKAQLLAGEIKVFQGPLMDQSGAVKVEKGKTLTDPEILGMNWFVKGIVGTTE
ncbi:MAG: BMP family ABC transporter substrate-binding protein [Desulfovibrio sp.]|uniref:BMP family ABC transporter substrate-binding protein n=1 Tax=Desulfovibrio sp. 7SRBS1 TaxID=3378064 RepID=UPI003B3DF657